MGVFANEFNKIDYLESDPEVNSLWYKLLAYLEPTRQSQTYQSQNDDISSSTNPFNFIQTHTDLKDTNGGETGFFDGIYESMAAALEPWTYLPISIDISDLSRWENYPWNESVAQLIQEFYFTLDPEGIKTNEDGWLVETEDGFIDEEWLKAGIKIAGRTNMRVLDIKNADAGNSFVSESEVYDYLDYLTEFTVTIDAAYKGTSELQKRFTNPYSYKINKKEILENSPLSYSQFFNMEKGKEDELSSDYVRIKNCLESEVGFYGWRVSDFKAKLVELPEYILENATGDSPLDDSSIIDEFYLKGTVSCDIIKIKTVANPWVIPWYNMDGATYRTVRGEDIKKSVMKWGSNEQEDYGKYFLNFTHKHNTSSDYYNWARLLMPQSKRRVEVEDLNRNFWVIGQTIAAITAYLLDPDGPYGLMIGGLLNEIMQIWENVLMMWGEVALQTQTRPDYAVEFVFVNVSDLDTIRSDQLYYDDIETELPPYVIDDITDVYDGDQIINHVHNLRRSIPFEDQILQVLRQYHKNKYADQNAVLFPLIRLNNYEDNHYSRLICPGVYRFQQDYEAFNKFYRDNGLESKMIKELKDGSGNDATLDTIGPVYAESANCGITDTSGEGTLGGSITQTEICLSCFKESFYAFTRKKYVKNGSTFTRTGNNVYEFDFSIPLPDEQGQMSDFTPYISCIFQHDSEYGYEGGKYFSLAKEISTPNNEPIYAMILPRFTISLFQYNYGLSINIEAKVYDLARYYLYSSGIKNSSIGQIEDLEKYQLYNKVYRCLNAIVFDWYDGLAFYKDIRNTTPPEVEFDGNKTPVRSEFGYYLGDVISNKQSGQRIVYDLRVYPIQELRTSKYPNTEEYKAQYGHNDAHAVIQEDMRNDELALKNFLRNAWDWHIAGRDNTTFWMDKNPSPKWTDSSEKISTVGYEYNSNWESKQPIIKSRKDVPLSYANPIITWEEMSQWQTAATDRFTPPGDGDITSSTILFVSGHRNINFVPEGSTTNSGIDFISQDGFIHHEYRNGYEALVVPVGAAIRLPIPGNEPAINYYPLHTDPTGETLGGGKYSFDDIYGWRSIQEGHPPIIVYKPDGTKVEGGEINDVAGYNNYALYTFIPNEDGTSGYWQNTFPSRVNSASATGTTQYIVMRKEGDNEITLDNWRVCQIQNDTVNLIRYMDFKPDSDGVIKFERKNGQIIDATGQFDRAFDMIPGREKSIGGVYMDYDVYLFRKYIMYKLFKDGRTTPEELSKYSLSDLISEYKLETLLFGWLYVCHNDIVYKLKFNYQNPYDYSGLDSNSQKIIEKIRENCFINNDKNTSQDIWNFIKLFDESYWEDGRKPTQIQWNERQYVMGRFNGIYDGGVNISSEAYGPTENPKYLWYEDRVIDRDAVSRKILQMNILAEEHTDKWIESLEKIFKINYKVWAGENIDAEPNDISMEVVAGKLEQYIYPLEGDYGGESVNLVVPGHGSVSVTDRIIFQADMYIKQKIFVFGPEEDGESLYARRGIYRYPTSTQGTTISGIDDNNRACWPARPVNTHLNTETNWKDDYDQTGYTVDELRDGYEIIYIIKNEKSLYEQYKSCLTQERDKAAGNTAQHDDLDFENIDPKWSDDYV